MQYDQTVYSTERLRGYSIQNAYFIDGHPLMCAGYKTVLKSIFKSVNCHECFISDEIPDLKLRNSRKDLVIIDIFNIGSSSLDHLIDLRITYPKLKVVICTDSVDPILINWCLSLGASGFIPKKMTVNSFASALKAVAIGINWIPLRLSSEETNKPVVHSFEHLTQKELASLKYLILGMINRDIARNMGVTESTTKSHVSSIIRKMGVINRTQVFSEYQKICQRIDLKKKNSQETEAIK